MDDEWLLEDEAQGYDRRSPSQVEPGQDAVQQFFFEGIVIPLTNRREEILGHQ